MKKKPTDYLQFYFLLKNRILDKNREILAHLDNKNLDCALNAIDERESMIKLINHVLHIMEKNALPRKKEKEWGHRHANDNIKILQGLNMLKGQLEQEILNIHIGRIKLQGYNLNKVSRFSATRLGAQEGA